MHSVEAAISQILAPIRPLSAEDIPINEALGRILAKPIYAGHNLPPFANSSMDGFAVIGSDVQAPPTTLKVIEDIPAGHDPQHTLKTGQAARIMTGAPLPPGADTVVPVEDTNLEEMTEALPSTVTIYTPIAPRSNIRVAGEDVQEGELILEAGKRLNAADLGILAGLGFGNIMVIRQPHIAVISTGDELLAPELPLSPGKIHDMNRFTIPAILKSLGAKAYFAGTARDHADDVRRKFQAAIHADVDLIVSSAGVSVGAFDVIKTVLEELGSIDFWRVNIRPGKPLTVGQLGGIPFIGLPGNPVSAMVTCLVFVRPIVAKMLGTDSKRNTIMVRLGETMESDGRMTFARVRLEAINGQQTAFSTGTQSSGAISSLVKADALLIIPEGKKRLEAGDMAECWPLDFLR